MKSFLRIVAFLFVGILSLGSHAQQKIVVVNGIWTSHHDAREARDKVQGILNASETRIAAKRRSFVVKHIYNPIGITGDDPKNEEEWALVRTLDVLETYVLKSAEENIDADYAQIISPHNQSRVLVQSAATNAEKALDEMPFGENDIKSSKEMTALMMTKTWKAALDIYDWQEQPPTQTIVIAHSQGNLLANLAWARLVSKVGQEATKRMRIINVANVSAFSPHRLNLTHTQDVTVLDVARVLGRMSARTTPKCTGTCTFTVAPATLHIPNTYLGHSFVGTYLSPFLNVLTAADLGNIFGLDDQGVAFTPGKSSFRDRFEDYVYAAAESLDRENLTSWDLVKDFSLSKNPNGAWRYGYDAPLTPFQLMGATASNCSDLHMSCWKVSASAIDLPLIAVNNSGGTINWRTISVPNSMMVLHPGFVPPSGTGQRPIVSWTAPESGTYAVNGQFRMVDFSPTGVRVLVMEDSVVLVNATLSSYGSTHLVALTRTLVQGQILSFVVDSAGHHSNDSTGMLLRIERQ